MRSTASLLFVILACSAFGAAAKAQESSEEAFRRFLDLPDPIVLRSWRCDASLLIRHYITDWVLDREPSLSVEVLSDDWGKPVPLYTP